MLTIAHQNVKVEKLGDSSVAVTETKDEMLRVSRSRRASLSPQASLSAQELAIPTPTEEKAVPVLARPAQTGTALLPPLSASATDARAVVVGPWLDRLNERRLEPLSRIDESELSHGRCHSESSSAASTVARPAHLRPARAKQYTPLRCTIAYGNCRISPTE